MGSSKNKRRDRDRKKKKEKRKQTKPDPESDPEDEADGVDLFKVEKIVDSKTDKKGQTLYRVRWVGYGPGDDTWEPIENVASTGHADRWIRECRARGLNKRVPGVALIEYEDGEQQLVDLKREKFRDYIHGNDSDRDDDSRDGDPDVNDFRLIREGAVIELLWPNVNIYFEAKIVSWTPLEGVVYRDKKKKGREKKRKAVKAAVFYGESDEDTSPETKRRGAKSRKSAKSMEEDPSFDVSSEEDESPVQVRRSRRSKSTAPIFDSSDNESPDKQVRARAAKKADYPFPDTSEDESPEKKVRDPAVNASLDVAKKPQADVKKSIRSSPRHTKIDNSDGDFDTKPKAKKAVAEPQVDVSDLDMKPKAKKAVVEPQVGAKKPTKRSRDESEDNQKISREETQPPSKKKSTQQSQLEFAKQIKASEEHVRKRLSKGSNVSSLDPADDDMYSEQGALKCSNDSPAKTPKTSNFSLAERVDVEAKLPPRKLPDTSFNREFVPINVPIPRKSRSPPPPPVPEEKKPERRDKRDKKSSSKLKHGMDDNEQKVRECMESVSSLSPQRHDKKKQSNEEGSKSSSLGKVAGPKTLYNPHRKEYSLDTDEYLKNIESSDESSGEVDNSWYEPPERVGEGVPLFNEPEDEFGSDDDDECESDGSEAADESNATPNDLDFETLWAMRMEQVRQTMYGTR